MEEALVDLARLFSHTNNYAYGDVILTADYYDPVALIEMRRK